MSHFLFSNSVIGRAISLAAWFLVGAALAPDSPARGQVDKPERPRRARLPPRETFPDDIFFQDAFLEALVGPRPAHLGGARLLAEPPIEADPQSIDEPAFRWSAIVSAETLEDEVKALQMSVDALVTTPARFSSGGFRELRREFSQLAMLFAVIAEYDGQVRWKADAPVARERFARAAANTKVSSPRAYQEAKQRRLDLQTLIRGGTLDASPPTERRAVWAQVCDRAPLMERLNIGYEERLAPWMGRAADFRGKADAIRREAELLRLIATVLTREGMEDADDADYAAYSGQLGQAARSVLDAVQQQDYAAARRADAAIRQACDQCHEAYR